MSNRTLPTNVSLSAHNIPNVTLKVKSNNNVIQHHADGACWDTVANKYVNPEDTNVHDPK